MSSAAHAVDISVDTRDKPGHDGGAYARLMTGNRRGHYHPIFALAAACLLSTGAHAESVNPPDISPPDSWQAKQSGTLRVLNKLDSTVTALTLKVGETRTLQSLSITLKGCAIRPPDLPRDAAARLTVADAREGAPGFDGWILQNEPAAAMLEHPVYDIQLAGCT